MPALSETKQFRFVWRNLDSSRWYAVTFKATSPQDAIAQFGNHAAKVLKRSLDSIVVDHYFYACPVTALTASSEMAPSFATSSEPMTLRDYAHPFHYEFANRVHSPTVQATA